MSALFLLLFGSLLLLLLLLFMPLLPCGPLLLLLLSALFLPLFGSLLLLLLLGTTLLLGRLLSVAEFAVAVVFEPAPAVVVVAGRPVAVAVFASQALALFVAFPYPAFPFLSLFVLLFLLPLRAGRHVQGHCRPSSDHNRHQHSDQSISLHSRHLHFLPLFTVLEPSRQEQTAQGGGC